MASFLSVSIDSVQRYARNYVKGRAGPQLRPVGKVGKQWRFDPAVVREFVARSGPPTAQGPFETVDLDATLSRVLGPRKQA